MEKIIKTKTFNDSYLYNKNSDANQKILFKFIMDSKQIDPKSSEFEDVAYEIKKRQTSSALSRVLLSDKTIIMISPTPLPKSFKSFVAKDIKQSTPKYRLFIDASDIIREQDGVYRCSNPDILCCYLFSGMINYIYQMDPKKLLYNNQIITSGAKIFSTLFTHIIDYLLKISSNGNTKDKCLYLSAMYYQVGMMGKDITDSVKAVCRKISGLGEREEQVLLMGIEEDDFENIKFFIETIQEKLRLTSLTLDAVVDKWVWQYGTGTHYALELFTSFANMISNVYIGAYINQQKTIEKVAGRNIVDFSIALKSIGSECV